MVGVLPNRLTIGVVEGDDSVRKALDRLFRSEGWGMRAFVVDELNVSLETACRSGEVACLLVDVTSAVAPLSRHEDILRACSAVCPIIALSTQEDPETLERARLVGSSAFFRKPVDDQALLDAIRWAVGTRT